VQVRAHDRSVFSQRWPEILARIAAAAEHGAEVIVVPEGTVPAYVLGTEPVAPALLEAAARDVIAVAERTGATIVYGGGRYEGDRLANSAYVVTREGIIGTADKCFLWHFDRRWFTTGRTIDPIATPAGKLGIFVCADGRIPTIASTLVDRGAELLVVPTAWVTSGRDVRTLENIQADLMAAVRARENGVPLVAANKTGIERRSVAYCGKSQIIAADGTIVAIAGQDDEVTLRASVAVGSPLVHREAAPAPIRRGSLPVTLAEVERFAITLKADDDLRELAILADAAHVFDVHEVPVSHEVAYVDDEAVVDPRALVGPRVDGVRLFVWNASLAQAWVVPFARTRAAELRAYLIVLDTRDRRAFAVDPDGAIVCGTFAGFELAAFTFDRRRTDAWLVAPHTDVRDALERVRAIGATDSAKAPASS
jgi:predicted amidohydrolase